MRTQWVKCLPCEHEIPRPMEKLCSAVHMCKHSTGRQRQVDPRELRASQFSRNKSTLSLCSLLVSMWLSHTHFLWSPYHLPPSHPSLIQPSHPQPSPYVQSFHLYATTFPKAALNHCPLWFLEVCQARHTN